MRASPDRGLRIAILFRDDERAVINFNYDSPQIALSGMAGANIPTAGRERPRSHWLCSSGKGAFKEGF